VWAVRTSQETSRLCYRAQPVNAVWGNGRCFCENRTENTDTLCGQSAPQRKHHISATEPNRLRLCGETVAVCCENRTENTDTLWAVRTSQGTYHFSPTEPNRLMRCGETVAVCCENLRNTRIHCGQPVPHRRHRHTYGQNAGCSTIVCCDIYI
jgi:hypothetical protein